MRIILSIVIIVLTATAIYAADFTDYKVIVVASPLINQIYVSQELGDVEDEENVIDMDLTPDSEIGLYENLSDDICNKLANRYEDQIEFICYSDIQNLLDDAQSWSDFNSYFTGTDHVEPDIAAEFADKLQADAVLNSNLIFSYYANSEDKRHLETHFEWYLIDLKSGELVLDDKNDCEDDFEITDELMEDEFRCFNGIVDSFAEPDEEK